MSNLPQTFEEWLRWTRVAVAAALEQAAAEITQEYDSIARREVVAKIDAAPLQNTMLGLNIAKRCVEALIPADSRALLEAHDRAERHDELEMAHIESQRTPDLATLRGYMAKRLADLRPKAGEGTAK